MKRTAAEVEAMLHAAHASALHWSRVGSEVNRARANVLLRCVYALHANGVMAMRFARRGYEYVVSHESVEWKIALAHAILAHSAYAEKDMSFYASQYDQARILGEAIGDAKDRDVFRRVFDQLEKPS